MFAFVDSLIQLLLVKATVRTCNLHHLAIVYSFIVLLVHPTSVLGCPETCKAYNLSANTGFFAEGGI